METVLFTSKGRLYRFCGGEPEPLSCGAVEAYRKNLREINKKRDWKTTGQGAQFMGMGPAPEPDDHLLSELAVDAAVPLGGERILYAAVLQDTGAVHIRHDGPEEPEQIVLRSKDLIFYDLNPLPGRDAAVVSCGEPGVVFEKNIALLDLASADVELLTEGDSIDAHPFAVTEHAILFDSRGLGLDAAQQVTAIAPAQVLRLNRAEGTLSVVLADDKFEFVKPKEDEAGNLYCIKRPYRPQSASKMTFWDVLLLPVRFLRAIFGWMNFFSRRYTGEALKTGGVNPAKNQKKSEEQLFIEGNLVNADASLKENQKQGDRYAGIAPRSWVLMKYMPSGAESVLRRGVMDYDVTPQGEIVCSNGKHILRIVGDGAEEKLCEAALATALRIAK